MSLGRSVAITDTGKRRRRNEDAYVRRPPLFAIADGMGGAQAGEVASRLAAAVLNESPHDTTGEARVAELVQEANRRVFERANEDAATQGMGTTMTVALVDEARGTVSIGHVGDSRAYRLRDGELEQLTRDHSLVQELVESGRLSPEEADSHPQRSVITRVLGTDPDVDVDTLTVEARPGDLFLLCSDGLTAMVDDGEIERALENGRDDLEGTLRKLVDAANRGGGDDNITAIVFEIRDGEVGDTQTFPAVGEADLEDTLDERDAVPAIDAAVLPGSADGGEERGRKARRHGAGQGRRWPALLALVLAVAVIAALIVWGFLR
jgi:PPM family protein phosphatase